MNTVLSIIILIRQNNLKVDNNYIVASYILENINQIESKTIQEVASDCHVSTNTVLRFCQMLGFNTYRRFKSVLISTVQNRKEQIKEKNKNIDIQRFLENLKQFSNDELDLNALKNNLDVIVEEIAKYKVIHLYGASYPLALAQSFVEDMALLGIVVYIHQVSYSLDKLVQNDEGIHIVVSYSGRFMEINRSNYREILSMSYPTVLISKSKENIGDIDHIIHMPDTISGHYDDIVLLIIYDYLLICCYFKVNNV